VPVAWLTALLVLVLRIRWMSPGGAKPLTLPWWPSRTPIGWSSALAELIGDELCRAGPVDPYADDSAHRNDERVESGRLKCGRHGYLPIVAGCRPAQRRADGRIRPMPVLGLTHRYC
jgi:hypothetical protein